MAKSLGPERDKRYCIFESADKITAFRPQLARKGLSLQINKYMAGFLLDFLVKSLNNGQKSILRWFGGQSLCKEIQRKPRHLRCQGWSLKIYMADFEGCPIHIWIWIWIYPRVGRSYPRVCLRCPGLSSQTMGFSWWQATSCHFTPANIIVNTY